MIAELTRRLLNLFLALHRWALVHTANKVTKSAKRAVVATYNQEAVLRVERGRLQDLQQLAFIVSQSSKDKLNNIAQELKNLPPRPALPTQKDLA